MVIVRLEEALIKVDRGWRAKIQELDPLAQELLEVPAWETSKILIGAALPGGEIAEDVIAACLALQFLEQALRLGHESRGEPNNYIENHLLITDYLYAQAIDQVIAMNRPPVIGWLAKAIMRTAEDRVKGDYSDYRRRLTTAALEIGSYLGESDYLCQSPAPVVNS
jgi:hypothetical protein